MFVDGKIGAFTSPNTNDIRQFFYIARDRNTCHFFLLGLKLKTSNMFEVKLCHSINTWQVLQLGF